MMRISLAHPSSRRRRRDHTVVIIIWPSDLVFCSCGSDGRRWRCGRTGTGGSSGRSRLEVFSQGRLWRRRRDRDPSCLRRASPAHERGVLHVRSIAGSRVWEAGSSPRGCSKTSQSCYVPSNVCLVSPISACDVVSYSLYSCGLWPGLVDASCTTPDSRGISKTSKCRRDPH